MVRVPPDATADPAGRLDRTAGEVPARGHALSVTRSVIVGALVLCVTFAGLQLHGWFRAAELHDRLLVARTADVPAVLAEMGPYRRWLDPMLRRELPRGASQKDRSRRLRLALALLPRDQNQVPALVELLLWADPEELTLIRDALRPFAPQLTADLWGLLSDPAVERARRLRAAGALADYDPTNAGWRRLRRISPRRSAQRVRWRSRDGSTCWGMCAKR